MYVNSVFAIQLLTMRGSAAAAANVGISGESCTARGGDQDMLLMVQWPENGGCCGSAAVRVPELRSGKAGGDVLHIDAVSSAAKAAAGCKMRPHKTGSLRQRV